jgi:hypothetical protein
MPNLYLQTSANPGTAQWLPLSGAGAKFNELTDVGSAISGATFGEITPFATSLTIPANLIADGDTIQIGFALGYQLAVGTGEGARVWIRLGGVTSGTTSYSFISNSGPGDYPVIGFPAGQGKIYFPTLTPTDAACILWGQVSRPTVGAEAPATVSGAFPSITQSYFAGISSFDTTAPVSVQLLHEWLGTPSPTSVAFCGGLSCTIMGKVP